MSLDLSLNLHLCYYNLQSYIKKANRRIKLRFGKWGFGNFAECESYEINVTLQVREKMGFC